MKLKVIFWIFSVLVLSVSLSMAQENDRKITVSGYVMDASSKPMTGVLILIDNKNTSVYTDNNGYYKVRISPEANMIGVLLQDNQVRSQFIDNRSEINFSLKDIIISSHVNPDNGEPEVLADVGISKIPVSKSDVLDKSLDKNTPYSNIYEMIQGKLPGVYVHGQTIRIRGISSIDGDNDPLMLVDGVPVHSIDHIIPSTVESITVLKGSSAAIYGSRGLNGIIVINLKKATQEKSIK